MTDYPQPDSHMKDKVKIVLDLPHYASKKEYGLMLQVLIHLI